MNSPANHQAVIPAQAGTQGGQRPWIPASAGMTKTEA
jgi:hypothetical protein